jgi:hypothetical protein
LLAANKDHKLLPKVMKWLLNNREGNRWHSTKATSFAILAISEYSQMRGELDANWQVELMVDGQVSRTIAVTPQSLFSFEGELVLSGKEITAGEHTLHITRKGTGACYYTIDLEYFSQEEYIEPKGHEIFVSRKYYKIDRVTTTLEDGRTKEEFKRTELKPGDIVTSGQLIDVELEVESKNEYEYLIFEDPKPAGCEAVEVRSGWKWAGGGRPLRRVSRREGVDVRRVSAARHGQADLPAALRDSRPLQCTAGAGPMRCIRRSCAPTARTM